ncbi:hypothetical protein PENSPDRAFT_688826 [Peniophora sp. CONT]|nr:hypothetical protein PENSPDRAFT_688826 [Peniophora sp. CONT]
MWPVRSKDYELVFDDRDSEHDALVDPASPLADLRERRSSADFQEQVILWSLYVVSVCVVLSATAVGYAILNRPGTISVALKSDFKKLEWRSSYIDFDVLYGPNARGPRPTFAPFIQHAAVMAPVSSVNVAKVYTPPTTYALLPHEGYASVQSRHLIATNEMSTVAQFRTLDWGMDNCTVDIVLPPATNEVTTLNQIHAPSTLSLWLLDPSRELDVKKLSYATKPTRVSSLGQLTVSPGVSLSSPAFACPRDAFPTVEVECVSAQCAIDVLHTGRSEGGLFLRQAQSVF